MRTDELDFDLPPELIAQHPATPRDASRLMRYQRATHAVSHHVFRELPKLLRRGDLLVFNDARVLPAKFTLSKPTGGRVGALFLEEPRPGEWIALLKGLGPVRPEVVYRFEAPATSLDSDTSRDREGADPVAAARILEHLGEGRYRLLIDGPPTHELLEAVGAMPLPPYIRREHDAPEDRQRYQTVFAKEPGSVAAPTAGLHFTPELLARLAECGVLQTSITLHVGLGTFRPISTDTLEGHQMHAERYTIPPDAAQAINAARREGRRVIAVGTTAARVLESQPPDRPIEPKTADTAIFIHPPYAWKHVDALVTNFHLPRSTLIALVAAFVGLEQQRRLYRTAIEQRYRFFSYGDAMLVE